MFRSGEAEQEGCWLRHDCGQGEGSSFVTSMKVLDSKLHDFVPRLDLAGALTRQGRDFAFGRGFPPNKGASHLTKVLHFALSRPAFRLLQCEYLRCTPSHNSEPCSAGIGSVTHFYQDIDIYRWPGPFFSPGRRPKSLGVTRCHPGISTEEY